MCLKKQTNNGSAKEKLFFHRYDRKIKVMINYIYLNFNIAVPLK